MFEGWRRRREELRSIVPIEYEWLDGSYVTAKSNASDIDIATFIRHSNIDSLSLAERMRVMELTTNPRAQLAYQCDSYLCVIYPEGHSLYDHHLQQCGYWDRWWSRFNGEPGVKGYLEIRDPQ